MGWALFEHALFEITINIKGIITYNIKLYNRIINKKKLLNTGHQTP